MFSLTHVCSWRTYHRQALFPTTSFFVHALLLSPLGMSSSPINDDDFSHAVYCQPGWVRRTPDCYSPVGRNIIINTVQFCLFMPLKNSDAGLGDHPTVFSNQCLLLINLEVKTVAVQFTRGQIGWLNGVYLNEVRMNQRRVGGGCLLSGARTRLKQSTEILWEVCQRLALFSKWY